MKKYYPYQILLLITALVFCNANTIAQPFIDIVNIKYTASPGKETEKFNKTKAVIRYFGINTNLPLQFRNKKDALVFSPFFESWSTKEKDTPVQHYYSVALPVTLSKTINETWSFLITGILRMNDKQIDKKGKMQVGGAFIMSYKKTDALSIKLGMYVNNEYFNVFVMPLAGIDWKINNRNNLYGVLPGNLVYEHRRNGHFYYGASFRAITNSYYTSPGYWRIDENQLGIYLDTYLNKNFVLNIEGGHSVFRKLRTGVKNISVNDKNVEDNFYIRCSLAYRVRFRRA